jgi:hypothetical protein
MTRTAYPTDFRSTAAGNPDSTGTNHNRSLTEGA